MYIDPNIKIHANLGEAKDFYEKGDDFSYLLRDKKKISIADVPQGTRNLIVGEPGIGKSWFLERIKEHLEEQGIATTLIKLRDSDSIRQIDRFVENESEAPRALLLDALDEVRSNLFSDVLKKIGEVSHNQPSVPIYISARWVFISRYPGSFPSYRFITLSPFTHAQIREYLGEKHDQETILAVIDMLSFRQSMLVIQIPRYLSYLNEYLTEYLKSHPATSIKEISRNDLFEYFINEKLRVEEEKPDKQKAAINKRMLAKLALSMEIYQTNSISKDEVMTFLDEVDSDLKVAILSQSFDIFYDNSLLKVSSDDVGKVAFDNTEFQEYLAAKEITRLTNPARAAFSFAADPDPVINAIYPSWFNAMTFCRDAAGFARADHRIFGAASQGVQGA